MKYKLTIIKYEDNKNYESELAKYKEDSRYYNRGFSEIDIPQKEIAERSLEVFLTEGEYEKVKQEVIKIFK